MNSSSSVSDSGTKTTDTNTETDKAGAGYQPVTNFEPQERVNPFDKEPHKSASGASINTASSSSSMSSSSISSRINRNGNAIKSPPPPAGPPPPPPSHVSHVSNANSSSGYRNSFSSSLSKDKTSYGNYGSSTSVETITRMDTNTTNTGATATEAGEASGITAITNISNSAGAGTIAPVTGTITTSVTTNDWRTAIGMRSASVYSAPAAVTTTGLPGDTSGYDSNSIASQDGGLNNPSDLPSYTRPSYSRSESNASKQSDLDLIFGDSKTTPASYGNGKFTRAAGSISDADMIFGGPPSNYKTDRFGAAKSMSMSSSGVGSGNGSGAGGYKIYDGIQNAAFSDFSDSGSVSSIGSHTKRWSANREDDDELDLK